jgi:hypothetical protein
MIKFRVFDKQEKKYVSNDNIVLKSDGLLYRVIVRGVIEFLELDPDRYVVELSTGLKDKNGKEYYAGDKCVDHFGRIKTVEYFQDRFILNTPESGIFSLNEYSKNLEIIGNINGDENGKK